LSCAGLAPLQPLRGGNRSDAAVPSPRPSLRWLRSEANLLPRSAPELAVRARNRIRLTARIYAPLTGTDALGLAHGFTTALLSANLALTPLRKVEAVEVLISSFASR